MLNAQGATPEQNNRLPKESRCGYDDCTTKKLNSVNRKRYSSGIFLPKILQNHGITTPVIYSELAVRATLRTKTDYIRTNKGGGYLLSTVVEPLSHLSSDKPLSLTRKLNTMKKPTSNVILYLQNGTTFICAQGVSLERAEEIKAHIKANPKALSYRDVSRVEIQTLEGGKNE